MFCSNANLCENKKLKWKINSKCKHSLVNIFFPLRVLLCVQSRGLARVAGDLPEQSNAGETERSGSEKYNIPPEHQDLSHCWTLLANCEIWATWTIVHWTWYPHLKTLWKEGTLSIQICTNSSNIFFSQIVSTKKWLY